MAREYNPSPRHKSDPVIMLVFSVERKIGNRKVNVWHAKCAEDKHDSTGDSESEAALGFQAHLSRKHAGRDVRIQKS
jgi:hypothetical protein